jgi:hypothetical protein
MLHVDLEVAERPHLVSSERHVRGDRPSLEGLIDVD